MLKNKLCQCRRNRCERSDYQGSRVSAVHAVESFGAGKCQQERREGVETRKLAGPGEGYLLQCCSEAIAAIQAQ